MKTSPKMGVALKTSVAALAFCMPTGSARAAAVCARPQETRALQTAALQQRLMVAALICHDTADYNRFVISHRPELQESDRTLMSFFIRRDAQKGTDDYSAYKTELANESSLRSARDPRFCRSAKAAFEDEFKHQVSLAEMVSRQSSLIKTGYVSCTPSARDSIQMAEAAPGRPALHQAFPDDQSFSVLDPNLSSRLDRALPLPRADAGFAVPPREDPRYAWPDPRDARGGDNPNTPEADENRTERQYAPFAGDAPRYDPEYADRTPPLRSYGRNDSRNDDRNEDSYGSRYGNGGSYYDRNGYGGDPRVNGTPDADRFADDGPYADRSYRPYSGQPYAYWPPTRTRFVRGPDGRWYLLLRNPR